MQSTWENLVDYDMSESGVRPLTLRELVEMGFDLESFLDQPLGYSQSNGTIELRERHRGALSRARPSTTIEVTNGTSEANYLVALSQLARRRRRRDGGAELHADAGRRAQPRRDGPDVLACGRTAAGSRTGTSSSAPSRRGRGCSISRIPNNPTGSVLSGRRDAAHRRSLRARPGRGCWPTRCISAPRSTGPRTQSFWGMSDRVIVTSGLSKAYGIPGRADRLDRRAARTSSPTAGPARLPHDRPEQDVGPHRAGRGRAAEPRALLRADAARSCAHNLPIAREWVGELRRPPDLARAAGRRDRAGQLRRATSPSLEIAERVRVNQSTLIVPGEPRRPRGLPAHLAGRARGVPAGGAAAGRGRAAPGPEPRRVSERSERAHANGARRRSGARESVSGSPRGNAPRSARLTTAVRLRSRWVRSRTVRCAIHQLSRQLLLVAGLSAVSATPAAARGRQEKAPVPAASAPASQIVLAQDQDARETRERARGTAAEAAAGRRPGPARSTRR